MQEVAVIYVLCLSDVVRRGLRKKFDSRVNGSNGFDALMMKFVSNWLRFFMNKCLMPAEVITTISPLLTILITSWKDDFPIFVISMMVTEALRAPPSVV